ncbi:MAG: TlyA family RNA methyltransferase [Chloroflexi bacterium]|nr:TlyA family RNA methyltransferase [Chloroflexota bacterium]
MAATKKRVDTLLVEQGLAESRSQAQRLILAGQVRANGQVVVKPAVKVPPDAVLEVAQGPRFVSRGGEKLQAALDAFPVEVAGRVCADVGASTGGFTDCLLQHGAARVYAIDVGKGILHWKLRNDPRVIVMEATNARYVTRLPEPVSLVTVDASFISLKVLLPVIKGWFESQGDLVVLIKPQFEAGRREAARGRGVIRDPAVHRRVLTEVLTFAQEIGYAVRGVTRSPVLGPKGNVEFLAWLTLEDDLTDEATLTHWIEAVIRP